MDLDEIAPVLVKGDKQGLPLFYKKVRGTATTPTLIPTSTPPPSHRNRNSRSGCRRGSPPSRSNPLSRRSSLQVIPALVEW